MTQTGRKTFSIACCATVLAASMFRTLAAATLPSMVACPASWPDAKTTIHLTETHFWYNTQIPFGPDDISVPEKYRDTTLIECNYRRTDNTTLRLTLRVPPNAKTCDATSVLRRPACTTDAASAAVRTPEIHPAEALGLETNVAGMRLSQPSSAAISTAKQAGFDCATSTANTHCTRANEAIDIRQDNARTAQITWTIQGVPENLAAQRDKLVYRFGLERDYTGPKAETAVWKNPKSGISLRLTLSEGKLIAALARGAP